MCQAFEIITKQRLSKQTCGNKSICRIPWNVVSGQNWDFLGYEGWTKIIKQLKKSGTQKTSDVVSSNYRSVSDKIADGFKFWGK